jgi:uncharacterized protein involved in high-affinity Fe2+ transport
MSEKTPAHKPPMKESDEAKKAQLKLARDQGDAYIKALNEMVKKEAHDGDEKHAGNYIVAIAVEHAEGMYMMHDGQLEWMEPDGNAHIEVSVRDAADNRFVPGLTVHVTVMDSDGKKVGKHHQDFIWHPWLYHYGRNWQVPGDGAYTLQVHIDPPVFMRHDKTNGKRYAEPVEVSFDNVKIETGVKQSP